MTTKISLDNIQLATLTALATVPKVTAITYPGNDTAADVAGGQTIYLTGGGFVAGATVMINGLTAGSATVANSSSMSFTTPAISSGTYALYVMNPDGGTAILYPGISFSGVPAWANAAGSLGTFVETTVVNRTLSATSDSAVTYSLYSGSLPSGVTLNQFGVLSGSSPMESSSTTYSFVIRATDAQNQDTDRAFSLTIVADTITWVNPPTDGYTYTVAQDSAISPITLSSTTNSGYAVSYSANALPAGLTLSSGVITGTPTTPGSNVSLLTGNIATLYRTATRVVNWTVVVGSDAYWKYTSLMLSANAQVQSNSFIYDSSVNNAILGVVGDTKPSYFNPYVEGYYSVYFNGSTDYLSLPASSTLVAVSNSNFTIDLWFYTVSTSNLYPCLLVTAAGWVAGSWAIEFDRTDSASKITIWIYNISSSVAAITSTASLNKGTWYHVALMRNASTLYLYINGAVDSTASVSTTAFDTGTVSMYVGSQGGTANTFFNGYISNLRIVKNRVLYTSNFTITDPLLAVSGTALLTCKSGRYIDNSPNNLTITTNGSPTVSPNNPFANTAPTSVTVTDPANYSMYFDGTTDWLSLPANPAYLIGTGNFTIEFWIYMASVGAGAPNNVVNTNVSGGISVYMVTGQIQLARYLTGGDLTGSITWSTNTWYHIAVTRNSSTAYIFINGTLLTSGSVTTNYTQAGFNIGGGSGAGNSVMSGYMSNVRFVNGTALYTAPFTPSTTPLTAVAPTGTVAYSTYFDGTGDYLALPAATNLSFGTNDFTLECWIYATAASDMGIYEGRASGSGTTGFTLTAFSTSVIRVYTGAAALISSSGTTYINLWTHVAVVRYSGTTTLYINGVSAGSSAGMGNLTDSSVVIGGGRYTGTTSVTSYFTGYISNFRIVIGQALYTAAFTPATTPLTTTSQGATVNNVVLLICQSAGIIDNSRFAQVLTRNGDVTPTLFNPFYANATVYTSFLGCQNNTVVDNGILAAPITVNNDARPRQNGPFIATTTQALTGSEGSAYLDGTGDYLTLADSPNLEPLANDFTVELWCYPVGSNAANGSVLFSKSNTSSYGPINLGFAIPANSNYLQALSSTNGSTWGIQSVSTVAFSTIKNSWNHVAYVRNGSSFKLYLNGVQVASTTSTATLVDNTNSVMIGYVNYASTEFPGYISNVRYIVGQALYTSAFFPGYAPMTANANTQLLTLQGRGSHNNSTILDRSLNTFPFIRSGNVTNGTFSPYGTGWSNYFNGSSYFTTATNSALVIAFQDFTVEGWAYWTGTVGTTNTWFGHFYQQFSGDYGVQLGVNSTGYPYGFLQNGNGGGQTISLVSATLAQANVWTHYILSRQGANASLFINGTRVATSSVAGITLGHNAIAIGMYSTNTGGAYWNGYVSNVREVIGTAVYDPVLTTATVPTAPYSWIPKTTFLGCQNNRFIDNGPLGLAITVTGSPSVQKLSPFPAYGITPYYSTYFNGSSGLSLPNTNQSVLAVVAGATFTVEAWIYLGSLATSQIIIADNVPGTANFYWHFAVNTGGYLNFSWYIGSSVTATSTVTAMAVNNWYHVALSVNAGAIGLFVNGVSQAPSGTTTLSNPSGNTGTMAIGQAGTGPVTYLTGYISNLRIVKGRALYTGAFTTPTAALGLTQSAGTNIAALTAAPLNGYSVYFNGSSDYLTVPFNQSLNLTSGDWTIEAWIYMNAAPNGCTIIDKDGVNVASYTQYGLSVNSSSQLACFLGNGNGTSPTGTTYTGTTAMSQRTWYHVAVVRTGTTIKGFVNGNQEFSTTQASAMYDGGKPLLIGYQTSQPAANYFNGYISNVRITKGVALYTGAFTAPTAPLGLSQSSGTNVVALSALPTNSSSVYFNGSSDYITTPSNTGLGISTGDFTIELWVYFNSVAGYQNLFDLRSTQPSSAPTIYIANNSRLNYLFNSASPVAFGPNPLVAGTWYHVAWVRFAGTNTMYVNGTSQASFTDSSGVSSSLMSIGARQAAGAADYTNGYISNLRMTKGQALYTANFTPATSSLTTTSQGATAANVSLLTCQSTTIIDNSPNLFTITTSGTPTVYNTFSPFGYSPSLITCQGNIGKVIKDNSLNNSSVITSGGAIVSRVNSPFAYSPSLLTLQGERLNDNGLDNVIISQTATGVKPLPLAPFSPTVGSIPGSYTPIAFGGSMYFDGTTDMVYMTVASTSPYPVSGDFTVEAWIYPTSASTAEYILMYGVQKQAYGADYGIGLNRTGGFIAIAGGGGAATNYNVTFPGSATAPINQWSHIALVRYSNTLTAYLNGVAGTGVAASGTIAPYLQRSDLSGSLGFWIGTNATNWTAFSPTYYSGYISDLRYVVGAAVYATNFYPSNSPLLPNASPNASTTTFGSMLFFNGSDGGVIDVTRTVDLETVGDAKLVQFSPYSGTYYSVAFSASTSDNIAIVPGTFGANNFTIEFWVNTSTTTGQVFFNNWRWYNGLTPGSIGIYINSDILEVLIYTGAGSAYSGAPTTSSTITTSYLPYYGKWTHIAVSRSGANIYLGINGIIASSSTLTSNTALNLEDRTTYNIGAWNVNQGGPAWAFAGYMSNFRIVKGTALYTAAYTVPATPLTAVSGTTFLSLQSNKFVDNSSSNLTLTLGGSPKVSSYNPFQINTGTAYSFDGTGDYLVGANNLMNYSFPGDFTIEFWVYLNNLSAQYTIIDTRGATSNVGFTDYVTTNGKINLFQEGGSTYLTTTGSLVAGVWTHVAYVRSGSTIKIYFNGVADATTATNSTSWAAPSGKFNIGANKDAGGPLNGYLTDLRITRGYARYTATFTPPITQLLIK